MDSQIDEDPNVKFLKDAQDFLDQQPLLVQAEVIAIASWLYGAPGVDGETKFLKPGQRTLGGVRFYERVYDDGKYTIVYEFDAQADPPLLLVKDILSI